MDYLCVFHLFVHTELRGKNVRRILLASSICLNSLIFFRFQSFFVLNKLEPYSTKQNHTGNVNGSEIIWLICEGVWIIWKERFVHTLVIWHAGRNVYEMIRFYFPFAYESEGTYRYNVHCSNFVSSYLRKSFWSCVDVSANVRVAG